MVHSILPLVLAAALQAGKADAIASDTQLTLDGGPFRHETVTLPVVSGDWYVTASEAHATFTFHSGAGPRQVALETEWEGKQAAHQLTNDTDPAAPRMQFVLTLERGGQSGLVWRPTGGATTVTVSVDTMTDHDLVARVAGALEGTADTPAVHVSGTIRLHRAALPAANATATYGDCDPVIHDRLRGAEDRAPSECEVKFDADVRAAAHQALARVISTLESSQWQVEETSQPLQEVPRASERAPFRATAYAVSFTLDRSSAEAAKLQAEVQARLASAQPSIMNDRAAMARFQAEIDSLANAMKGRIDVRLNIAAAGLTNGQATHTTLSVPGAALALRSTGAETVTLIYLGTSWRAPTFEQTPDGERFSMPFALRAAGSPLAVQNVEIAIRASAATADRILGAIDLAPLQALLSK